MRRLTLAVLASAIACIGCASGIRATTPATFAVSPGGLAEVVASDETPSPLAISTISDTEPVFATPQTAAKPSTKQKPAVIQPAVIQPAANSQSAKPDAVPAQVVSGQAKLGVDLPRSNASPVDLSSADASRASSAGFQTPQPEPYDSLERYPAGEEIITPEPTGATPFKAKAEDEAKLDRFNRNIVDVEIDIRPTEGEMPTDRGAQRFADQPVIDESLPTGEPADVLCAYTPWTICYRPLYFEDIGLERYGKNVGCLQTGLSGVRFFGSIAALPYKMTRRPPRSCECSNGFSRPGDCPLPGYGNRRLELDAAIVEAAAITAVVYIIP